MDIHQFIEQLSFSPNNINSPTQNFPEHSNNTQTEYGPPLPPLPSDGLLPSPISPSIENNHDDVSMSPMRPGQRRPLEDPTSPEHIRRPSPGLSHPPSPTLPSAGHSPSFFHLQSLSTNNPHLNSSLLSPPSPQSPNFLTNAILAPSSGSSSPYSTNNPVFGLNSPVISPSSAARETSEHVKLLMNNLDLNPEHRAALAHTSHLPTHNVMLTLLAEVLKLREELQSSAVEDLKSQSWFKNDVTTLLKDVLMTAELDSYSPEFCSYVIDKLLQNRKAYNIPEAVVTDIKYGKAFSSAVLKFCTTWRSRARGMITASMANCTPPWELALDLAHDDYKLGKDHVVKAAILRQAARYHENAVRGGHAAEKDFWSTIDQFIASIKARVMAEQTDFDGQNLFTQMRYRSLVSSDIDQYSPDSRSPPDHIFFPPTQRQLRAEQLISDYGKGGKTSRMTKFTQLIKTRGRKKTAS